MQESRLEIDVDEFVGKFSTELMEASDNLLHWCFETAFRYALTIQSNH